MTRRLSSGLPRAECHVRVTTMPTDEALARIVSLLRQRMWTVLELHHRCGADRHHIELTAGKVGGRAEQLLAALEREVVVVDVAPSR